MSLTDRSGALTHRFHRRIFEFAGETERNSVMGKTMQTNRAVPVKKISSERSDIPMFTEDVRGAENLTDEDIRETFKVLNVGNFNEFLSKFEPTIYAFFDTVKQHNIYALKKPEGLPDDCITEIPLRVSNDVSEMILKSMDAKRAQSAVDMDCKYEDPIEPMSLKSAMEDINRMREEINCEYEQYATPEERGPEKPDIGDRMNSIFEEAGQNYNKNILAMLYTLFVEDIDRHLLQPDSPDIEKNIKTPSTEALPLWNTRTNPRREEILQEAFREAFRRRAAKVGH
jgi:hypothetical protein